MSRGKFCKYTNTICSEVCEYAYESTHGSDILCCTRPETKEEKIVGKINIIISTLESVIKKIQELK